MNPQNCKVWLAVAPALVTPLIGALGYFVLFKDSLVAQAAYGGAKAFILFWPVLAVGVVLREPWPRPGRSFWQWRAVPVGALAGLAIVLALLGLMATPIGGVVASGAPSIRAKAETFHILEHYWTFALLLSIGHSLLEEYYWRWFVYGQLRRIVGKSAAHILAGAAFAAHHVVVTAQFFGLGWGVIFGGCVGLGGMIWSVLYERQGTLLGAWASHLIVDLGILTVGHRLLFGTYFY